MKATADIVFLSTLKCLVIFYYRHHWVCLGVLGSLRNDHYNWSFIKGMALHMFFVYPFMVVLLIKQLHVVWSGTHVVVSVSQAQSVSFMHLQVEVWWKCWKILDSPNYWLNSELAWLSIVQKLLYSHSWCSLFKGHTFDLSAFDGRLTIWVLPLAHPTVGTCSLTISLAP